MGDITGSIVANRDIGRGSDAYSYASDGIFSYGNIDGAIYAGNPSTTNPTGTIRSVKAVGSIDGSIHAVTAIDVVRAGNAISATITAPTINDVMEDDDDWAAEQTAPTLPTSVLSEVLADTASAYADLLADVAELDAQFALGVADFLSEKAEIAGEIDEARANALALIAETKTAAEEARDKAFAAESVKFTEWRELSAEARQEIVSLLASIKQQLLAEIAELRKQGDKASADLLSAKAEIIEKLTEADAAMADELASFDGRINDEITYRERAYRAVAILLAKDRVVVAEAIPEGPGPYDGWRNWFLGEFIVRPQLGDDFLIHATDAELDAAAVYLGVKYGLIIRFAPMSGGGFWGSVGAGAVIGGADYLANKTMTSIISGGRTEGPTWRGFASATAWGGAFGAIGHAAAPHVSKFSGWVSGKLSPIFSPVKAAVAKSFASVKNRVAGWFGKGVKGIDDVVAPKWPAGLTKESFEEMSTLLRRRLKETAQYGDLGDDIVVQGGRAAGKNSSDIDIGIRVSAEKFNELIEARLKTLTPGSDTWKTLMVAKERGRIHAGEIGISGVRKEIQRLLGIETDLSVILKGGPFDNPPFIPVN